MKFNGMEEEKTVFTAAKKILTRTALKLVDLHWIVHASFIVDLAVPIRIQYT